MIQVDGTTTSYEFGIMGLACKREILQVGDPVTFQADAEGRATNIVPIRKKRRGTVDAIKGKPKKKSIKNNALYRWTIYKTFLRPPFPKIMNQVETQGGFFILYISCYYWAQPWEYVLKATLIWSP